METPRWLEPDADWTGPRVARFWYRFSKPFCSCSNLSVVTSCTHAMTGQAIFRNVSRREPPCTNTAPIYLSARGLAGKGSLGVCESL